MQRTKTMIWLSRFKKIARFKKKIKKTRFLEVFKTEQEEVNVVKSMNSWPYKNKLSAEDIILPKPESPLLLYDMPHHNGCFVGRKHIHKCSGLTLAC